MTTKLWNDTRDEAIRDMTRKTEALGCRCITIPFVASDPGIFPIKLRMTHSGNCPVARQEAAGIPTTELGKRLQQQGGN
jgi:hypothetical protein